MKKKQWTSKDIRDLRTLLDLSQAAFGDRLGVTGNYIWMLEAGQKTPSDTIKLLLDCVARENLNSKGGSHK